MTKEATSRAAIEAWFLAHEADLADPSHEGGALMPEQLASLEAMLREAGITQNAPGQPRLSGAAAGASAIFLGQVIGDCFGRKPTLQMLRAAERLVQSDAGWAAFSAAVASEVGSDASRLAGLVRCLQDLVYDFTSAPRKAVYALGDNMCALVDQYRQKPRMDDLWFGSHSRIVLVKHAPAFDALRLIDAISLLKLLETFPHPEPIRHIVSHIANRMCVDELFGMLALTDSCFDAGTWLPWIKTPFLIVAAIDAKLEALPEMGEDNAPGPSEAFLAASEQAVQSVLGRTDGNDLGYAWLQWLVQRRTYGSRRQLDNKRTAPESYFHLSLKLAAALPPRHATTEWVRAEQDIRRRDRAIAAIAAAGLGETGDQHSAAAAMRQVLQLGLWTTGLERSFSAASAERQLVASVIGRHVAPEMWFDELWRDLAPLRDRARCVAASAGGHAGDATVIAVSWFLFGLGAVDVHTLAHRALWRSLHSAVREGAMTQSSPMAQAAWRLRYRLLGVHLARRLTLLADREASQDLRSVFEPILCLDLTLAELTIELLKAGTEPTVIAASVERPSLLVELLRRLQAEQAWREDRQREQLGGRVRFSQAIGEAADTIEAIT